MDGWLLGVQQRISFRDLHECMDSITFNCQLIVLIMLLTKQQNRAKSLAGRLERLASSSDPNS